MGLTAQSLTCSIMEKPHTWWMNVRESYSRAIEQGTLLSGVDFPEIFAFTPFGELIASQFSSTGQDVKKICI